MGAEDYSKMTLISTHPVKKGDLGFHGNLFGGKLLAWCDAAGAALEKGYEVYGLERRSSTKNIRNGRHYW